MAITQINVQRFSITSSKSCREVIGVFDAALGHPDMDSFRANAAAAETFVDMEKVVNAAIFDQPRPLRPA